MSTPTPTPIRPAVNAWNAEYLEAQYEQYRVNPGAVASDLREFFSGFDLGRAGGADSAARANGAVVSGGAGAVTGEELRKAVGVATLIEAYRELGHTAAAIDPFGREPRDPSPMLNPSFHGLDDRDMDRAFPAGSLSPDGSPMTLRAIIDMLDTTYCGTIGVEFHHVTNVDEREWLMERMERTRNHPPVTDEERRHILQQLQNAEGYEKFCSKRYPTTKRFSLEGGESLIPMLDRMIDSFGGFGVREVVMGMAHRGRVNVLANIVGKTYEQIFTEFEDAWTEDNALGGGDVKYHRGYSNARQLSSGGSIWISLASNPSHLESQCAVVLGKCRAKQRLSGDVERSKCVPILMHGDAAAIAQGVMAEVYNLSQLEGYTVGGTVHIVINNLVGFTTGPEDARSSRYCTDIAKMIEAPVFHVNGEDPEAVVHVARMAVEYRMRFKKDIVVDLVCYRFHGHNEVDVAAFTQPVLYQHITGRPSVLANYSAKLVSEGVITPEEKDRIAKEVESGLDRAQGAARQKPVDPLADPGLRRWEGFDNQFTFEPVDTAVSKDVLEEIADAMGRLPEGFTPHEKLVKEIEKRASCVRNDLPLDWALGESFAVGSLLLEAKVVRLSGQDSGRGTFSHRHAVLHDFKTGATYVPLNHIRELGVPGTDKDFGTICEDGPFKGKPRQAKYCVFDSPLSEYSVMGFEYGFSMASPDMLVMWEAQFGDFSNGAQVIIDQFLAAGEVKWQRWSGLTLLLPHGYEGQGPEHSSARLERFLLLCGGAVQNMIVAYPSTPAQYFHLLRRQVKSSFRKPLVVMTPKSLLRLPEASSRVSELTGGRFLELIDDPMFVKGQADRKGVQRVILCAGKVYYDLIKRRAELNRTDIAVIRVEQLYPLHLEELQRVVEQYPKGREKLVWVQEEPQNAGAWQHMFVTLSQEIGWNLPYIGRLASSTPATGSPRLHAEQLEEFLSDAIGPSPVAKVPAGAH
ncbi:MAG TPA: multifunctional oxoglutarate decarboxylase/oxoglutarate dehydrogenase thiamine pyrophosphate-binding subunit/dihydrolipoyllysine-residue succinyltransferase subunit [Phycisphaerales bacterium]|nr:multifunctional oxoglutarate decarboxylase/oxoglutarate dehydrogenase thiamine pyrophosphate-binding subunit/dihydrolipoyllysine-residue succinyltransferase subunit [Phycisphaerales bacterium]